MTNRQDSEPGHSREDSPAATTGQTLQRREDDIRADIPLATRNPELLKEVKRLSRLQPARAIANIAFNWVVIGCAITGAIVYPGVLTWVAAIIIVGARQHALLIIMHDASHFRIARSRIWNDVISDAFCSIPLFVRTASYRASHIKHHQHLNTDKDPDWVRKEHNPKFSFPKSKSAFLRMMLEELCWEGFKSIASAIYGIRRQGAQQRSRYRSLRGRIYSLLIITAFVALVAILYLVGALHYYLLFWLLPAVTVLPVVLFMRSIAEHFGLERDHELNSSRFYTGPWWERAFIAPHNVGHHLDHHLYPSVPFYNLPKLHTLLMKDPEYRARAHRNDNYFGPGGKSILNDVCPDGAT